MATWRGANGGGNHEGGKVGRAKEAKARRSGVECGTLQRAALLLCEGDC